MMDLYVIMVVCMRFLHHCKCGLVEVVMTLKTAKYKLQTVDPRRHRYPHTAIHATDKSLNATDLCLRVQRIFVGSTDLWSRVLVACDVLCQELRFWAAFPLFMTHMYVWSPVHMGVVGIRHICEVLWPTANPYYFCSCISIVIIFFSSDSWN